MIWIDAVLIWFVQVSLGFSVRMLQSLLSLKLMLLAVSHKGQPVLKEPLVYFSRIRMCRLQSPFLQRIHGKDSEPRAGVSARACAMHMTVLCAIVREGACDITASRRAG